MDFFSPVITHLTYTFLSPCALRKFLTFCNLSKKNLNSNICCQMIPQMSGIYWGFLL